MKNDYNTVADYYDNNTAAFLRFGHGGREYAIHRAVWGPGVSDRKKALHYVDELIIESALQYNAGTLIDLGCGCGASMLYIANRLPGVTIRGITLSREQHRIGTELIKTSRHDINIQQGNYLDPAFYRSAAMPASTDRKRTLFFAVESFLHSPEKTGLFERVMEAAQPGDLFIVCDDFLSAPPKTRRTARLLQEFIEGWRVSNLQSTEEFCENARRCSFSVVQQADLTDFLELNRFRDRLIRCIVPFLRLFRFRGAYSGNLIGGNALQQLLLSSILCYRCFTLRRLG
jgi:hypothetical protein